MKKEQVLYNITTPVNAPAYTPNIPEFRSREYITITYETDRERLEALVPEPLVIDEPLVKFECIRMPDSTALGDYTECGQLIPVSYNGVKGDFNLCMYLDNAPSIAVGREITAYPKKYAKPEVYVDSDTIVAKLCYGTLDVAVATMAYKMRKMTDEEALAEIKTPQFMLKIMRDYVGRPLLCQLVKTAIEKANVIEAWASPARLQLFEHVSAPLADLPVRKIVHSSHILANLTLGRVAPVFDYLTGQTL